MDGLVSNKPVCSQTGFFLLISDVLSDKCLLTAIDSSQKSI
jgi:hypothetical protein